MTDAERDALREEIEGLTIRAARARGEVATETLRVLAELGIGGPVRVVTSATDPRVPKDVGYVLPSPTACPVCQRDVGSGGGLDDCALGVECLAHQGRIAAGAKVTNKGHPVGLTAEERQRKLSQPAFDANGEPISG